MAHDLAQALPIHREPGAVPASVRLSLCATQGPSKKSSCGNLMELNDEARHQSSLRFRPNAFGRRAEHLLRNIAAAADGGGSVGSVPILRDGPRQIAWVTLSESLGY